MVTSIDVVPTAKVLKKEDNNTVTVVVGAATVDNCERQ
jgi:hypothetical protein